MQARSERFLPPIIGLHAIERSDVVRRLNMMSRRGIVFLHAPAGYGKTTAAALWARNKNVAWLSLDEYSTSPADIYRWILYALSCEMPCDFSEAPLQCLIETMQTIDKWPEALVIDDFHLCADQSVSKALPLIRARLPEDMAFIVLSRNAPPPVLHEHVSKGLVKPVTDLAFSVDEITKLFAKNKVYLSGFHAEMLANQTGGWGAALSAVLMSHERNTPFEGILNRNTLNHYLRSHVFEYWDDYPVLKKCAICAGLNPGLCNAVAGQENAWDIIEKLADKTGLVIKQDVDAGRFHDLLREFLLDELHNDKDIDKPGLYKTAANWYSGNRDFLRALDMAAKSGDMETMEEISRATSLLYGEFGMDVEGYARLLEEKLLIGIPKNITAQYPRLSIRCFHAAFLSRGIEEALCWLDVVEAHMEAGRIHPDDYISAAFTLALDTRRSSWHVPKQFDRVGKLMPESKRARGIYTLTQNLPFFHKSQRDYTDIAPDLPEFILEIEKQMSPILGPFFKPLAGLTEAGILYERGQLTEAELVAKDVCESVQYCPPEIRFSSYALYFEILRVQGKTLDLGTIAAMIVETKADYLRSNWNAYTTLSGLMNGDRTAASDWLAHHEDAGSLKFYTIFQSFTTARAMMVMGKLSAAVDLLRRLAKLSADYERASDTIEALTLIAICQWNMKQTDDSVQTINSAIVKAAQLQITMPIIKEGIDVIPILQKVLNRLKYGYDAETLDKAFVNTLFLGARNMSRHTRGMFAEGKTRAVKLSPRQKEILLYLAQNLSYKEIADKTGVKVTTVVDHIGKLYEKIKVNNAHDAVLKAEELGIMEGEFKHD